MDSGTRSVDDLSGLSKAPFDEVVREFESQMAQSNRAFLLGAGCSRCANLPLMSELTEKVFACDSLSVSTKNVLEYLRTKYEGSHGTTIEDYMSDIVDILTMAKRRRDCGARNEKVAFDGQEYGADDLEKSLNEIKDLMVVFLKPKNVDIARHREFVRTVCSLRTGKRGSDNQVDYFVLNYDTLVEDALGLECLPYVDGFTGGAVGWWDADTYKKKDTVARVFKLHGSVDWRLLGEDSLPRRMRDKDLLESIKNEVREPAMIWPAATKYRETQRDPYAQILELMRESFSPRESREVILTICGYRFADMHINAEIDRALRQSQRRLNVLIFTEDNEPVDWVKRWFEDKEVNEQVRIHAKRGFFHADKVYKSNEDLPWWKFENIVRLLGGEK
jgi:hypothetical protein